jgi:hypothetical protein
MMSFVRDNLEFVSALALVLSVLSFVYTYFRDRLQNRRWNALNVARIAVRDLRLASWKVVPKTEFDKIDWGYPDFMGIAVTDQFGDMDIDHLRLPIKVEAMSKSGGIILGTNSICVPELLAVLQKNQIDISDIDVYKMIRVVFVLVNSGSTVAHDLTVDVSSTDVDASTQHSEPSKHGSLQPGEQTWTLVNLRFALEELLPPQFHLTISFSFVDVNAKLHRHGYNYILEKGTGTFRRT